MPQVEMIKTWETAEVETELGEAIALVQRLAPPDDLRQATFSAAVSLLTNRLAVPTGGHIAMPPAGLH